MIYYFSWKVSGGGCKILCNYIRINLWNYNLESRQKVVLLGNMHELLIDLKRFLIRVDKIIMLVTLSGSGVTTTKCSDSGDIHLGQALANKLDARTSALEVEAEGGICQNAILHADVERGTYSSLNLSSIRRLLLTVKRDWSRKLW